MSKRLSICILQTNLPSDRVKSGGEERVTKGLAEKLASRHDVTILTKGDSSLDISGEGLAIRHLRCTNVRFFRFFAHTLKLVRVLFGMKKVDIIQCNISDRSNGLAGMIVSKMRKVPLVTRVPGFDPPAESLGRLHRWALKKIFESSALVVSINRDFLVGEIRRICPECRIVVLPHGIETSGKARPKKFPGKRAKRIVFVGRLVWFKNVGMLIRVVKMIKKESGRVSLEIVGRGPEERGLKELAKTLGVEGSVVFSGELDHDDVMQRMRNSDVFVFPSIREPRGLVLIEAMAAGLPIVAIARGGPKDIVKNGVNGFLVEPEDDKSMARRVSALLSDKALYERISENNVRDVRKYSWENVAREWEKAYFSAIQVKGGGSRG